MPDVRDWNRQIIEEFRANEGRVGGRFDGSDLLLLHSRGARTGREHVTPLVYQPVDDGFAVFASKGGAPDNPDWFHNLVANPEVHVEVGTDTVDVRARVAAGDEREVIWTAQKRRYPGFAEYEASTDREIPVLVLEPVG